MTDKSKLIEETANELEAVFKVASRLPDKVVRMQIEAILGSYGIECGVTSLEAIMSGSDCPEGLRNSLATPLALAREMQRQFNTFKIDPTKV